jgi:hypothetical protein
MTGISGTEIGLPLTDLLTLDQSRPIPGSFSDSGAKLTLPGGSTHFVTKNRPIPGSHTSIIQNNKKKKKKACPLISPGLYSWHNKNTHFSRVERFGF